jgi:hypothetical protein
MKAVILAGGLGSGFYEDSGMHEVLPTPIDVWLRDTNWDDQRRFESLAPILAKKLWTLGAVR